MMFQKTRLKLTAWYLLIIMLISICFSMAIYRVLTIELDRVERMQRQRQDRQLPLEFRHMFPRAIDPEVIEETKQRLILRLMLTNLGILSFAGIAGYFLAGRTLNPIKEMVEEQNRFITDSSHELRTPLTSLKSEIEVGLRDKKITLADAKKLLESNLEEVNNLQYLSDNLIKLTKSQITHDRVEFVTVSLTDVLNEATKKVTKLAHDKKVAIKNQVEDYQLNGDRQSLIELFVILLDNAIKYSNKDTAATISSESGIHSRGGSSILIKVKDEGMGIDEKDLPHIFDRFYRADSSRAKSETPGYGLGLAIAKQIVEKHSGSIKAESEIGKGSTFFVHLPFSALPQV